MFGGQCILDPTKKAIKGGVCPAECLRPPTAQHTTADRYSGAGGRDTALTPAIDLSDRELREVILEHWTESNEDRAIGATYGEANLTRCPPPPPTHQGVRVSRATQMKNILMSGPNNLDYGENQPMKHSIAQRGELKATFSTGSSCDLWPVTRGSHGT